MNADGATFSTPGCFSFRSPDLASSGLDSSYYGINPNSLNSNFSIDPALTSNTFSSGNLSLNPPSSSTGTEISYSMPLNNATNNYSDTTPVQLLPGHDAYNMPHSDNAPVPSGSKCKADFDENYFPSRQLQGSFNGTTSACTSAIQPGDVDIPPEIAAIEVNLDGLRSLPVVPSVELPSCSHLLTTVVLRQDVPNTEARFYPYLWFPNLSPYMLQRKDYDRILDPSLVNPMKNAFEHGMPALTASRKLVIFSREAANDVLKKYAGPSSRWQGGMGIPDQNRLAVPDTLQAVSEPSMSYPTNTVFAENHTKESYAAALSGPKRKPRARAKTIATEDARKPKAQRGKCQDRKAKIQAGSSGTARAETTNQSSQQAAFGGYDLSSTTNTAQSSVPLYEAGYADPLATPAVSTANQAALSHIVSGCENGSATASQNWIYQQPEDLVPVTNADLARYTQIFEAFTNEPQVPVQESYSDIPEYQQGQFDVQQVDRQDPSGPEQASASGFDIEAFESSYNQPQPSHVDFDTNGDVRLTNLNDDDFYHFLTFADQNYICSYDSVRQAICLQPRDSSPGVLESFLARFHRPFVGQAG